MFNNDSVNTSFSYAL